MPPIVAVEAMPRPTPIAGLPPPTFASAVPRGEGDGCRSFSFKFTPKLPLSGKGSLEGGAGEADLRETVGTASVDLIVVETDVMIGVGVGTARTGVGASSFEVDATG